MPVLEQTLSSELLPMQDNVPPMQVPKVFRKQACDQWQLSKHAFHRWRLLRIWSSAVARLAFHRYHPKWPLPHPITKSSTSCLEDASSCLEDASTVDNFSIHIRHGAYHSRQSCDASWKVLYTVQHHKTWHKTSFRGIHIYSSLPPMSWWGNPC